MKVPIMIALTIWIIFLSIKDVVEAAKKDNKEGMSAAIVSGAIIVAVIVVVFTVLL